MKRSTRKILTTHNGSLPRPPELRELLLTKDQGKAVNAETFDASIQAAVSEVVRRQANIGLTVVNDGEQSKASYSSYVKDRLTGFGGRDSTPLGNGGQELDFPEFFARQRGANAAARPCCDGPIAWKDFGAVQKDIDHLRAAVKGVGVEDVFMSTNSPGNIVRQLPNRYYGTDEEYLQAAADAMKREYEAVADSEFVLQIDCPDLASSGMRGAELVASRAAFRKEISRNLEVLNYTTRNIPPEKMRFHVCWGAPEGPHHRDTELKEIVDILMKVRAQGISIVGANPRHEHEWKVWKDVKVPDGKVIIMGIIDSTTNFIEHHELVAERIVRYASVLGRENLMAGVDCGFATGIAAAQPAVDPKIAWAKLHALTKGADLASKELW